MAGIKHYADSDVEADFHEDENVIYIKSKKGKDLDDLKKVSDKIKNVLNVDSVAVEGPRSISLKLDQTSTPDMTHEFMQTMLGGGFEEEDAEGIGQDAAREDSQTPEPPAPQGQQPPEQAPQEPQQGQEEELPQESLIAEAFDRLYNSYMLKESTYRTGQYWDSLVRGIGKNKQMINFGDILTARKLYTKKRKSESRNEVLRSLDKGAKYFYRKLKREQGPEVAKNFMDEYRSIGGLVPSDYSEGSDHGTPSALDQEEAPGLDLTSMDVADFFPQDEEDESSDEDSDEESLEKLTEPEKEEYPE